MGPGNGGADHADVAHRAGRAADQADVGVGAACDGEARDGVPQPFQRSAERRGQSRRAAARDQTLGIGRPRRIEPGRQGVAARKTRAELRHRRAADVLDAVDRIQLGHAVDQRVGLGVDRQAPAIVGRAIVDRTVRAEAQVGQGAGVVVQRQAARAGDADGGVDGDGAMGVERQRRGRGPGQGRGDGDVAGLSPGRTCAAGRDRDVGGAQGILKRGGVDDAVVARGRQPRRVGVGPIRDGDVVGVEQQGPERRAAQVGKTGVAQHALGRDLSVAA
ncbi:hypothetical protein D3C85_722350 [compost metagenome]